MKILMVNKFLHPNGGSETYIFRLGEYLKKKGHEVQYFGMEHRDRCVGNDVNAYTSEMDFHVGSKLKKLTYPFKTIYSFEARKKIRKVLESFRPDVVHLNNFNFQLTPSILVEIRKWSKKSKHTVKIIYTAHDYQLLCPNHMMRMPVQNLNCERCSAGQFVNCIKGSCIHGSKVKSIIGAAEGFYWNRRNIYQEIDTIICPSDFMQRKLNINSIFRNKTTVLHNFVIQTEWKDVEKKNYILYFGRFSEEKGVKTLLKVCSCLPELPFVFAGSGPLEGEVEKVSNIKNVGFQKQRELENLIREARFCICPSECYENCPFSVLESQLYGTPVLGADIGGIPELIQVNITGELFESGNSEQLKNKIEKMWKDHKLLEQYSENCKKISFNTIELYYKRLIDIYAN